MSGSGDTSNPNLPSSAWNFSQWYTKDGKFAFASRGSGIVNAISQLCPAGHSVPSGAGIPNAVQSSPAQCLTQHGYTLWTSYHPGSRFWTFQWIEASWLVTLSVVLIATTVWLVRRRAT